MDYQPSYGFLKDCLYRSESYKVTLADAYRPSAQGRIWFSAQLLSMGTAPSSR